MENAESKKKKSNPNHITLHLKHKYEGRIRNILMINFLSTTEVAINPFSNITRARRQSLYLENM